MEEKVAEQLGELLRNYGCAVDEVSYSSAVFLLSVNNGDEITQRVGKWFYSDVGERYFVHKFEDYEEYFVVVLFEEGVDITIVSMGVVKWRDQCCDIFSFVDKKPNYQDSLVPSTHGYVVEIACIAQEKSPSLVDFTDAKHIHAKYAQRSKNHARYYPHLSLPDKKSDGDFLVLRDETDGKKHPWTVPSLGKDQLTSVYAEYLRGSVHIPLGNNTCVDVVRPLPQTNVWGTLLYDIAAQSLMSASIPKTHLYIPWVVTLLGKQSLTLKVVV